MYQINTKGLTIGFYDKIKKPVNDFSQFKTANSLIYVMASVYKKKNNFDDCFILNENDKIVEATSSNIFLVKGRALFTPPVTDGCVNGIMRNKIIELARENDYKVNDTISIKPTHISEADEIILTNAVTGVNWVTGYKEKRFFNKTAKDIIKKLNEKYVF